MLEVGQKVRIKSSAKRYHGGLAEIREIDMTPCASKKYLIERTEKIGLGLQKFWAARGEFEALCKNCKEPIFDRRTDSPFCGTCREMGCA